MKGLYFGTFNSDLCVCMHMIAHKHITYVPIFQFVKNELASFAEVCQHVYLSSATPKQTLHNLKETFWM